MSTLQSSGAQALCPGLHHIWVTWLFSDILRIDNLWQFENLKKLQLNNNIIERIEGLAGLTHLVWLGKAWLCVCRRASTAFLQNNCRDTQPPSQLLAQAQ